MVPFRCVFAGVLCSVIYSVDQPGYQGVIRLRHVTICGSPLHHCCSVPHSLFWQFKRDWIAVTQYMFYGAMLPSTNPCRTVPYNPNPTSQRP